MLKSMYDVAGMNFLEISCYISVSRRECGLGNEFKNGPILLLVSEACICVSLIDADSL